jgi:transcriptional regulator with XRE-family HTH domain
MTVRGLAREIDVSPSLISQVERGRVMPSVGTLYSIVNELGLVVDDLFRVRNTKAQQEDRAEATLRALTRSARPQPEGDPLAGGVRWSGSRQCRTRTWNSALPSTTSAPRRVRKIR